MSNGFTPLHHAAQNGNVEMVKLLAKNGAIHSDAEFIRFERSLYAATKTGKSWGSLGLFVSLGSLMRDNTSRGWKPIHLAARGGHIEVVQLLRSEGESPTSETSDRLTALHLAGINGSTETMRVLMLDNASTLLERENISVHSLADFQNYYGNNIRYAMTSGCNVNAQDQNGWTPLHWANFYERDSAATWLEANGADITRKTSSEVKITDDLAVSADLTPRQLYGRIGSAREIARNPQIHIIRGVHSELWR
jgi:ankyrin repeat protein